MEILTAYHGDPKIKSRYLKRVQKHRRAEELLQGYGYWQGGKGCAVGCTIHGSNHQAYETELGIPQAIARLEDSLFERLPGELAQTWPERFLDAIEPGRDLSLVASQFLHWLLMDPADGVIQFAKTDKTRKAIEDVGQYFSRRLMGDEPAIEEWKKLRAAAYAAAAAAAAGAAAAAYAADAAAAAAAAAAAYAAAAYAARRKVRIRQSEKLLELLAEAPISNGQ